MLHSLCASCRRERNSSLYKQAPKAVAYEDYGPFGGICELTIGTEFSHKAVRKWQDAISRSIARRQEGLGIVVVGKYADVVALVWEEISKPKKACVGVGPSLCTILEESMDGDDAANVE